jgi:hypothetical protein
MQGKTGVSMRRRVRNSRWGADPLLRLSRYRHRAGNVYHPSAEDHTGSSTGQLQDFANLAPKSNATNFCKFSAAVYLLSAESTGLLQPANHTQQVKRCLQVKYIATAGIPRCRLSAGIAQALSRMRLPRGALRPGSFLRQAVAAR